MSTVTPSTPRPGRLRAAWTSAHTPVPGVPRWARVAAATVTASVMPASIWRIGYEIQATITGHAEAGRGQVPVWLPMLAYVIILSIASEALAFTAYGLIAPWGEVFPRWIPGLRGRRVPTPAAVVPAALGACVLTALWTAAAIQAARERDLRGRPMTPDNVLYPHSWQGILTIVCYAPLLLWGPLLGALTIAYWKRRTRPSPSPEADVTHASIGTSAR